MQTGESLCCVTAELTHMDAVCVWVCVSKLLRKWPLACCSGTQGKREGLMEIYLSRAVFCVTQLLWVFTFFSVQSESVFCYNCAARKRRPAGCENLTVFTTWWPLLWLLTLDFGLEQAVEDLLVRFHFHSDATQWMQLGWFSEIWNISLFYTHSYFKAWNYCCVFKQYAVHTGAVFVQISEGFNGPPWEIFAFSSSI